MPPVRSGDSDDRQKLVPLMVAAVALLFLLVQLRVIDLRPVFAQFALQESIGEAGVLVGLLTLLALLACRMSRFGAHSSTNGVVH